MKQLVLDADPLIGLFYAKDTYVICSWLIVDCYWLIFDEQRTKK
jgi:hypothetical protein